MLNLTSLGFGPDFFNLHCQCLNHSAIEVLYKLYTVLDILALLIHEDESMILYRTKSLDGTKPNTNPKPKLTQILTLFSSLGNVVTQSMPENK